MQEVFNGILQPDFIYKSVMVFFAMALADLFWTLYYFGVEKRQAFIASFWSVMILMCGMITTFSYIQDRRLMVPAIFGAFLGTYGAVKWKIWKENKQ